MNDPAVEMFEADNAEQLLNRNMLEFTVIEDNEMVKGSDSDLGPAEGANTIVKAS
ncbi:MAG: hypothetical protein IPH78_08820 [Bacteroidetes bacterium]|nr:hypothetical protein [Bacteroidota bacterium]